MNKADRRSPASAVYEGKEDREGWPNSPPSPRAASEANARPARAFRSNLPASARERMRVRCLLSPRDTRASHELRHGVHHDFHARNLGTAETSGGSETRKKARTELSLPHTPTHNHHHPRPPPTPLSHARPVRTLRLRWWLILSGQERTGAEMKKKASPEWCRRLLTGL